MARTTVIFLHIFSSVTQDRQYANWLSKIPSRIMSRPSLRWGQTPGAWKTESERERRGGND